MMFYCVQHVFVRYDIKHVFCILVSNRCLIGVSKKHMKHIFEETPVVWC